MSNTISFTDFILRDRINRKYLFIALGGTILQFIIFKLLYPYADFFSDSYSYLYGAYANLDVNIWPIGYSKFLRIFHFISHSDTALVGFQYFLYSLSSLYFFFSIIYFYNPVIANKITLFIFLFFNPLFLYVNNYINSDPIFLSLSLLWFTQLLWIIHRPKSYQIFTHAILLFLCFTIRNNAYYYPLISGIVFYLSKQNIKVKIIGFLLPFILIIPFITHTRNVAFQMTGTKQFSLFTGWQLANNALYTYEYVDTIKQLSPQVQELDTLSIQFFRAIPTEYLHNNLLKDEGNFFIRASYSPLKEYLTTHYSLNNDYEILVAWGKASAVFSEYGNYLIKNNPRAYLWQFMIPNMRNYFIPYMEKLQIYNQGSNKVSPIAQHWFNYKSPNIHVVSKDVQGYILYIFPAVFLLVNIYFLVGIIYFLYHKRQTLAKTTFNNSLILATSFQIANFAFCVFATIVVLRYQVFPMIICTTFSLLIAEWIDIKNHTSDILQENKNYSQPLMR